MLKAPASIFTGLIIRRAKQFSGEREGEGNGRMLEGKHRVSLALLEGFSPFFCSRRTLGSFNLDPIFPTF